MPSGLLGLQGIPRPELEALLKLCRNAGEPDLSAEKPQLAALFSGESRITAPALEAAAKRLGMRLVRGPDDGRLDSYRQYATEHSPAALAVSHHASGVPALLSRTVDAPVFNAGDGHHEHPVAALALASHILANGQPSAVALFGDLRHSGLARSLMFLFSKLDVPVMLCAPPPYCPAEMSKLGPAITVEAERSRAIEKSDAVIALPFHRKAVHEIPFPESEYDAFFRISEEHVVHGKNFYADALDGTHPVRDVEREANAWTAVLRYYLSPAK